jgi:glycine betaine/choline ABC-type transport system substrate-binding protein
MTLASALSDFGDAIEFIFTSRESRAGGSEIGGSQLLGLLWDHLALSAVALAIGIAVAVPLGVWLGHTGAARSWPSASRTSAAPCRRSRSSPSSSPSSGTGFVNIALALALLAIPPILANAYVGISLVEPDAVDAARGMGMTGTQIVRRVELPLALPLVVGGIRTSAVNVVATATIAPLAGVSSLGRPHHRLRRVRGRRAARRRDRRGARRRRDRARASAGSSAGSTHCPLGGGQYPHEAPQAVRAVDAVCSAAVCLRRRLRRRRGGPGAGGARPDRGPASGDQIQRDDANASTSITVGSKNFTEQKVLGEVYAQGLEAAGYKVSKELSLGDEKTAQKSLKAGEIDGYPEYTGTALLSLCDVPTDDIPKDPQQAFEDTKACFEKDELTAFAPTPFTSSNEVGVKEEVASQLGLSKISDLSKVDDTFTLYGSPECRQRTDCLLGLKQTYDLAFKKFTPVDIDLRHQVLDRGDKVVSIVFTTDPQNKREDLVLLEDDKGMFPPYNSTFVVRNEVARRPGADLPEGARAGPGGPDRRGHAGAERARRPRQGEPEEVATAYLEESGLIGGS